MTKCKGCKNKAKKGFACCEKCLKRNRDYQKDRYHGRLPPKPILCTKCKKHKPEYGKTKCSGCLEVRRNIEKNVRKKKK